MTTWSKQPIFSLTARSRMKCQICRQNFNFPSNSGMSKWPRNLVISELLDLVGHANRFHSDSELQSLQLNYRLNSNWVRTRALEGQNQGEESSRVGEFEPDDYLSDSELETIALGLNQLNIHRPVLYTETESDVIYRYRRSVRISRQERINYREL